MGKLYDAIKNEYEIILKFKELEKKDFLESRKFEKYNRVIMAQTRINKFLKAVDVKARELYKESDKDYEIIFKDFENIIGKDKKTFPVLDIKADSFYDCKPILDKIEGGLKNWEFDNFIEEDEYSENKYFNSEKQILNDKINSIRMNISSLNITNDEISADDRSNLLGLLGELNKLIVVKNDDDIMDNILDEVAQARSVEARNHVEEFANKNGYDAQKLKESDQGMGILDLFPETKEQGELLKDISNKNLDISKEYKEKILALDKLVTDKNIIQNAEAGESDHKEYSFNDWFNKSMEVKNSILKYSTLKFDQRNEKVNCLKEIIAKGKELIELDEKYSEVIEYIRENFDLEKVSIPANVYSGRAHPFDDIKTFKPDLPKKYDYDNAPYGVILNGYVQLKSYCNKNNISLKDFLDNPSEEYKKSCLNFIKGLDQKYVLPKENNSLGKRMAHLLLQADKEYVKKIGEFAFSSRAFEFICQTQEQNENTFDNYIKSNAATNTIHMLNHSAENMFNNEKDEPDYEALKSIFARGNDVDNLLTLSNNYRDENLNLINDLGNKYNDSILNKANLDPQQECDRVLNTIKDFLIERKYIESHEAEIAGDYLIKFDLFTPGKIIAAGREYFKDYLEKNKINVLDIRDKATRKKVLDFINDPTKAFQNKFGNDRRYFLSEHGAENIDTFKNQVKEELHNLYDKEEIRNIDDKFALNNQKDNGYNTGKNINTIISDNKGGFFERYILRNTSKEYKALENAVKAATNRDSATCGDYSQAKIYALKYLEHKLPEGTNEANISTTGKKRIEFCRSLLRTFNALPPRFEEQKLINEEVDNKINQIEDNKNINVEISKDNENFQKDLNENLNQNDKNISNDIIQKEPENSNSNIEISNDK